MAQFGDRVLGQKSSRLDGVYEGIWILMFGCQQWTYTISNGVTAGIYSLVTFEVHFWRRTLWIGRKDRCTQVLQEESGVSDGAVILVLGNIRGLKDAPERWWKILIQS